MSNNSGVVGGNGGGAVGGGPVLAWNYVKARVRAIAARYPTLRPDNWQVKKLLDLPVVNELVDNPHRRANSASFVLGDASNTSLVSKNLIAVLAQVTGSADPACDKCCKQHGLWQGCPLLDDGGGEEMDIDEDEDIPAAHLESYRMPPQSWQWATRVAKQAAQRAAKRADLAARRTVIRSRGKLWQQMRDENGNLPRLPDPAETEPSARSQQKVRDVPIERPSSLLCNDRALRLGPRTWWDEKKL
ncbi:hypothetical protein F5883DRAFT_697768 [Diaporthe sp. PMI_573]|nr:hypothetical protein F5883DRAFT_697768 [Diaporthaceae sp. PMI_573]